MIRKLLKDYVRRPLRVLFGINNLRDHAFLKLTGKGPVIVDLGANEGHFLNELMMTKIRFSEAILVEADPSLAQKLTERYAGQKDIKILNAAVGAAAGNKVRFYLAKNTEFNSLFSSFSKLGDVKEGQNEVDVQMVTLEDIFSLFALQEIDLLKIDIEGSEWDVLERLTERDFQRIHQISVEFHDFLDPALRTKTEKCIKKLKGLGYGFICKGTTIMRGTPYYNCLFYDKKYLRKTMLLRWFTIHTFVQKLLL